MSNDRNGVSWLVRVLLVLTCALVAMSCIVVWRMAIAVERIDRNVEAVSGDVKKVTATAARLSEKVDGAMDMVDGISEAINAAWGIKELGGVLGNIGKVREKTTAAEAERKKTMEKEVGQLLGVIRQSDYKYARGEREMTPTTFYDYLMVKYKIYEGKVETAEEFIDKVATKTALGEKYYVIIKGEKIELGDYLREELARERTRQ